MYVLYKFRYVRDLPVRKRTYVGTYDTYIPRERERERERESKSKKESVLIACRSHTVKARLIGCFSTDSGRWL